MNTTTKVRLTNRMKKLGEFVKANRNDEGLIYDKIKELFPQSCETFVFDDDENLIHFIVCEDYVGSKPTRKEMLVHDKYFKSILKTYGLGIVLEVKDNDIKVSSDIVVEYEDKWNHVDTTTYTIKEMMI